MSVLVIKIPHGTGIKSYTLINKFEMNTQTQIHTTIDTLTFDKEASIDSISFFKDMKVLSGKLFSCLHRVFWRSFILYKNIVKGIAFPFFLNPLVICICILFLYCICIYVFILYEFLPSLK